MERNFNLLKNSTENLQKRVLPKFPFCLMTCKFENMGNEVFEVSDISLTGAQLSLKHGSHSLKRGSVVSGRIHWGGERLDIRGEVQWTSAKRLGLAFGLDAELTREISEFLSLKNILQFMRSINLSEEGMEIPSDLKYWIRSDGPVEIFVWQHNDRDIRCFQVLYFERFLEFKDGEGLRTGRVVTKRDLVTPLILEDEFVFLMDDELDKETLSRVNALVQHLPGSLLDGDTFDLLSLKCRCSAAS